MVPTNWLFIGETNLYQNLLDFTREDLWAGFLIMINYIYNKLYNLQGWFVRVSDCEDLVGVAHRG